MEKDIIIETVNKLFIGTDERNWEQVLNSFNDTVELDYVSMMGGAPAKLSASEIIGAWKSVLPGFDSTHHQLGNYLVDEDEDQAALFCYGTATHYLRNDSGSNIWTVVGSYDFELSLISGSWKITKMKFNFKYMDGNTNLPALAQKKLQIGAPIA